MEWRYHFAHYNIDRLTGSLFFFSLSSSFFPHSYKWLLETACSKLLWDVLDISSKRALTALSEGRKRPWAWTTPLVQMREQGLDTCATADTQFNCGLLHRFTEPPCACLYLQFQNLKMQLWKKGDLHSSPKHKVKIKKNGLLCRKKSLHGKKKTNKKKNPRSTCWTPGLQSAMQKNEHCCEQGSLHAGELPQV